MNTILCPHKKSQGPKAHLSPFKVLVLVKGRHNTAASSEDCRRRAQNMKLHLRKETEALGMMDTHYFFFKEESHQLSPD